MKPAEPMGQETSARPIKIANDHLEHAVKLEEATRKG